jgi:hypothetical protein
MARTETACSEHGDRKWRDAQKIRNLITSCVAVRDLLLAELRGDGLKIVSVTSDTEGQ